MKKIYEIVKIKQEVKETMANRYTVRSPEDVVSHAYSIIGEEDREIVLIMVLNTKNHIIAVHRCHVGSVNASIIHPREIFKSAILNNGSSIVAIHEHPSGDPTPSTQDIDTAVRLKECGNIIGIELLDFLVIGEREENGRIKNVSLKENGNI